MTATKKKIDINIPAAFEPLFSPAPFKVYWGGRGGAKSHSFAYAFGLLAHEREARILCTREIQNSIADSVHKLLVDNIERLYLSKYFKITDNSIEHKKTGSIFIFKGLLRNASSIKSMEGLTHLWIEEAQTVSQLSIDILIPTLTRNEGAELWVSFNPCYDTDPIYTEFVATKREGAIVRKVSYRDNYKNLPKAFFNEMQILREKNYPKYLWVYEGEFKTVGPEIIFSNHYTVKEFDTPEHAIFYYGADFGFSEDPATIIRCFIIGNDLYIDREAGEAGVDIDDLGVRLYDKVLHHRKAEVRGDNSRPETISFLNKPGQSYNFVSCKKWKGCVEDGIEYIKSFDHIYVHPRCKGTIYEFRHYKHKVDPATEKVLPEIVDADNHYMDALRYALEPFICNKSYRQVKIKGV